MVLMTMEVLPETSDGSRANTAQSGVRVSQQAATPQQPTVLFTTPQQIFPSSPPNEQVISQGGSQTPASATRVRKNGLILQGTQTLALQQADGNVSIVHVQLPQSQSVIQPASHASGTTSTTSVIQATSAGAIQNLKNPVIFLNKNTVIQSAGHQLGEDLQLVHGGLLTGTLAEDDQTKKRRGELARRPSYRKILNELSMPQHDGHSMSTMPVAGSPSSDKDDTNSDSDFQLKQSTIHLQTEISTHQYVQYTNEGQVYVPMNVTTNVGEIPTYQLRPAQVTGTTTPVVVTAGTISQGGQQQISIAEEASRKRELRLLKNREAAKECRRKKKDYIKCLENRVTVLEQQNAKLIQELKTLKDLYCKKSVSDM